jgi:hypothetical protein
MFELLVDMLWVVGGAEHLLLDRAQEIFQRLDPS